MLDYIPFIKGQQNEIKIVSSIGRGYNSNLKNQKYTLKFLQNKQNYAKINKVTDYQSLLNSPEEITTRSLDIQQYEYILHKDGSQNRFKDYKISKGQQTNQTRQKYQQQSIQVENVHLNQNCDHQNQKKLEKALNRSKFNRVGSICETQRSQDSLSSIQMITRYQQLQQSTQYLVLLQQDEQNRKISNQEDYSHLDIEQQIIDITIEKNEEIVLNDSIDKENSIHKEFLQQFEIQDQQQHNDSYYAISLLSCPQQQSINNEISLINYDDDQEDQEVENEEQIFDIKQIKNKKQQIQKQQQKQQQSHSKTNQSIKSVKKSDGIRSNKISRQQSQMSVSDLDRIEQIIQQNEKDLDDATEEIQRNKMKQQIRDLEERIQKTKDREEQFQYNSEDYKDKNGEYLQTKKKEQQIQQEQLQNQIQQIHITKKQALENQSQAILPNQQFDNHIIIKSPRQEKKKYQDVNQNESKRISQNSIELERSVNQSQKDLEQQQNQTIQIVSDPLIKIENKLKEIQKDMEFHQNKQNDVDFADFLLTQGNVFDKNYKKYKIFQFDKQSEDPPGNYREEDKNLYHQMMYWDGQNTGNSKKILAVADIVRGVYTKFTSDANISEVDIQTQKSIDSDWE